MKANNDKRSRLIALAVMLVCAFVALPSFAQPSPSEKQTARVAMDEGDALFEKKDFKGALKKYQDADNIMHVPSTAIWVAKTHLELGELVEANEKALEIVRMPVQPNESAVFTEARAEAQKLADNLYTRIPSVTIKVTGLAEGVVPTVTVDGKALKAAVIGLPLSVNPGKHTIVVSAPGYKSVTRKFAVKEKEKHAESIKLEADPNYVAAPPPKPETVPKPQPPKGGDKVEEGGISPLVWAGVGVAGVGVIVGAITGGLSMSKSNKVKSDFNCDSNGACDPVGPNGESLEDETSAATAMANVSNVAFGVAGAGAVLAVVGLITSDFSPAEVKAGDVSLRPTFGLGTIGVTGTF